MTLLDYQECRSYRSDALLQRLDIQGGRRVIRGQLQSLSGSRG
jgi:hypothetical protein